MAKQVFIKQKAKIHTEARCFALKVALDSTNKERKYGKEFAKTFMFFRINKRGVLIRSGGWKNPKTDKRGGGGRLLGN